MTTYKAVFSDMDGTLLNSQHQISPKTQDAIRRVIQKGIPFIPVSARPPYAITPYTEQLQTQQAIVCYSGALILDKNLTALYSVTIEEQDLQQIILALSSYQNISINFYAGLNWFTDQVDNKWIQQEIDITQTHPQAIPATLTQVHKILVMGESEQIQRAEQELQQQFPQLSIHRSKSEYLEIMHQAATKSNAIRFMEGYLNVQAENVIAFGDNFNDLDMLQYAGLSIAMGNAPAEIKAAAKEITASHDEDGIALILEKWFA